MSSNLQDENVRKGPWDEDEDELLKAAVLKMGEGRWDILAQGSGLLRSGKSCRLRWLNYLCPDLKHGKISTEEEELIIQFQKQWGNKWSKIAKMLPGRTDNELKNYWRSRVRKQQSQFHRFDMYANRTMSYEQECSNAGTIETSSGNGGNQEFINEKTPDDAIWDQRAACISETSSFGFDVWSSDFGILYSPFEARLSHWMSDISGNQYLSNDQMETADYESWDFSLQCFYSLWEF